MINASKSSPYAVLSVVIPTFNRRASLLRTLASLETQTLDLAVFEVIVVDDGGSDGTPDALAALDTPYRLCTVRQANQGSVAARNAGAAASRAPYLVLLDDDITLDPGCLAAFLAALKAHPRAVILGHLQWDLPPTDAGSPFSRHFKSVFPRNHAVRAGEVAFTECLSGFMALSRVAYHDIGGMVPLTPSDGANSWCDVDFGYRAHRQGYRFVRTLDAVATHHDLTSRDFPRYCQQMEKVGRLGVLLLQKYPALALHLDMLRDKLPADWRADAPALVADKLFHSATARRPLLGGMQRAIAYLESKRPHTHTLPRLYRWTLSAYIYRGVRQGIREFGPL